MKKPLSKALAGLIAIPTLALLVSTAFCRVADAADAWQTLPQYRFGQSREPLAAIEEEIRKSGPAERGTIERRLLELLEAPATTQDSRRFICRWLGTVGTERSVAPLAALLTDPNLAHPARIALESLAHPSASQALVDALARTEGDLRLGVISSIGAKRADRAVPELAKLTQDPNPILARAALAALSQIGTEAASQALASAPVSPALARDLARARIGAASRLAAEGNRSQAATVFQELMAQPGQPPAIRVAAFQGLAGSLPPGDAARLLVRSLEGDDPLMRSAAGKAFASAGEARSTVVSRLPTLQPQGQLLLLGILADTPEVAARLPLLEVARSAIDPAIKAAAIECLAVHGQADDVPLVAQWAAGGEAQVKTAARKTLQRMSGPGVNDALIRLTEAADSGQRKAVLEALPSRRIESALPTLSRLVRGSDSGVAVEAAKTIGLMGGTAQIADLAQVMTATPNADLRRAAQDAIRSLCTRIEDKAASSAAIQAQLDRATTPEARAAMLPLTAFTGGPAGLAQVLEGMEDKNAEVREVAFRTLVAWPEVQAAPHLVRFATTNTGLSQIIVALRDGCLRLAEMDETPIAERASILRSVTQVARRPDEKRRAVSLMGQVPSLELLEYVTGFAADRGLRPEATAAAVQLARSLAAVYPRECMAALEEVAKHADTPELRQAVEGGVKAVRNAGQSPEGYIVGWMVSGPYTKAGTDGAGLFDVAFPPEQASAKADWRPLGAAPNGIVDLGKPMPGNDRVAYLRATVASEQDQKALLELGSDDGVKVWVNGEIAHANNAVRPCSPGQDKATVSLKRGDNVLLLKVTQGGGEWAAVARLRGTDGKPLSNVTVGGR